MTTYKHFLTFLFLNSLIALPMVLCAEEPDVEDGWLASVDTATGVRTVSRKMKLHPAAEPLPALKHRLLPDDFDLKDGNAALYYLKAMGFLEQSVAREKLSELLKKSMADAKSKDVSYDKVPPFSFQETSPKDLPIKQVKEYLGLFSFQPFFLEQARQLESFSLDRNIREMDNPIGYLLPEVQALRELARVQRVRCRLAIAEGRTDDAIQILGQQIALAKHLGQDEFYVSALVGMAIQGIAWTDTLYLIEHANTPNLYWAFASLPVPLVSLQQSHALERQFLFEQIKELRNVDETPQPTGYWIRFIDRFAKQAKGIEVEELKLSLTGDTESDRLKIVAFIAAAYPGASRYLIETQGMKPDTVDAYPTAQVVFLAMKRYYEQSRDEYFKWNYVETPKSLRHQRTFEMQKEFRDGVGFVTLLPDMLMNIYSVRMAQTRSQQQLALVQTIEAIRMYAAQNKGRLPSELSNTPVPAPDDPITGMPFSYEYANETAVLSSNAVNGIRHRFVLNMDNDNNTK